MDFLEFNYQYRVLICLKCKYAIQKNALESHLLRHKVYRGDRRRLLASLSKHPVLDPDDVQLPAPGSPPIDGIPVIQGYRCTATGCKNLCASIKRMRRHWSESHGVSDPPTSCSRSVNLQTLFRGAKLKYFEVSSAENSDGPAMETLSSPQSPASAAPTTLPGRAMDLETLKYFYHFITATLLTLPGSDSGTGAYWQTQAIAKALEQGWLMSGLLGVASSHMAALSDDSSKQGHVNQASHHFAHFDVGWEDAQLDPESATTDITKVGRQIGSLRDCCSWLLGFSTTPLTLREFVNALSSLAFSDRPDSNEADNPESPTEIDASRIPRELWPRLQNLPYQMSLVVGKPKSTLDFLSTLSAVDSLALSFYQSYSSDTADAAWSGMSSWLGKVPEHFRQLTWGQNTAALVVFWHWTLLVDRAECHYWFLKGSGPRARRYIVGQLPDNEEIRGLIGC
ncbi:hypothetical protein OQA88_755 [Cercophora sp. LCS_1]